jgi:Kef-type K+ transport system membrane component KefB/nucleotide-binding universal stress UspA family protein
MDSLVSWLPTNSPIVEFTILLLVVLILPPIFERLRLPGLVGLLVAGVCLGPEGLKLLSSESENMELLSEIGKIYLMFVAGLEIDLEDFRRKKERSLAYGAATFLVPLVMGIGVGQIFGMGWNTSVLIGSLMASHTLLGFPIVNRLGMVKCEAVTVTIGATIFTDIAALLILAICVSIHAGAFSLATVLLQLGALGLYSVIVLFGFDWAGKEYFRRTGDEEGNQFLFILLAVFLASLGAQLINVDRIVGAFLAGLAVNDVVGRSPVEEKVIFLGSTLFIPFFFVDMGLLLDVSGFLSTLDAELWLTLAIVGGLILSKLMAAVAVKFPFGYSWPETLTMWSLSIPQVAATLAAALVGLNVGLLSESVFNAVIVLMLVTSICGPILTDHFARRLPSPLSSGSSGQDLDWGLGSGQETPSPILQDDSASGVFTVVVPIYNPYTERYLIEAGAFVARHESGQLIPLSIAKAHVHMDEPSLAQSLKQSQRLLGKAVSLSQEFDVKALPVIRIDDDVARGISRSAREHNANLIILGWTPTTGLRARLFGNVIDSVFWSAHCPVAVMRLMDDPINIHEILVPVKTITPQALRPVGFAQLFAEANQAQVTVLHVCDRLTPRETILNFEQELTQATIQMGFRSQPKIMTLADDDVAQAILKVASSYDMVVLRSIRRRTVGGLAVSNVTTQVLSQLATSMVLFGEPQMERVK